MLPLRGELIWGKGYGEMEVSASIQRSSLSLQKVLAATRAGSRRPDIGARRQVSVLRDQEWGKRYRGVSRRDTNGRWSQDAVGSFGSNAVAVRPAGRERIPGIP